MMNNNIPNVNMNFDSERESLKKRIDEDVRALYTDERKLNKFQVNEKLLFITNNLWDSFQSIIGPIRKTIQGLESDILLNRFNLDETLKKHCKSKEDFKRAEKDLLDVEENLDKHRKQMQKIEESSYTDGGETDLKRLPFWVFGTLMGVVGVAEVIVYFYVFQSQEIIGPEQVYTFWDRVKYDGFPFLMALGFTVMMIWLAHKLGMMLRQYSAINKNNKTGYIAKFIVIFVVVIAAILATVEIRGKMHEITYIQKQITQYQDNVGIGETMGNMDEVMNETDDSDMSMDMGMSNTADMSMDMSDDSSNAVVKAKKEEMSDNTKLDKNNSLPTTQEGLERLVSQLKGNLASLFIFINLFIVVAGIFLSYEVHTSSIKYEALESMIGRLIKRKKELMKEKNKSENKLDENEKKELLSVLETYVQSVNTYDENSQVVKSLRTSIENIYVEMVYYMLGVMSEHNLLTELDFEYIEQFSPEYLVQRFKDEWKLEDIDVDSEEIMHVGNIDEFIEKFQCNSTNKKG